MALRHDHASDEHVGHTHGTVAHGTVTDESASIREPVGIAQAVTLVMGIFFVVIGVVGLARAGLDSLTSPDVEVANMGMTPLLALVHLVVGIIALAGTTTRGAARGVCMFLGPALIALGIVALIQPIRALGYDEINGIVYLIAGVVAITAGMLTPLALEERRTTTL